MGISEVPPDEEIVVCTVCYREVGPVDNDALRELAAVERVEGNVTYWDCPRCGKQVYFMWVSDEGGLEFGV